MKCPHCHALFANPHATETEANVMHDKNRKDDPVEVTVFSCPSCEAVFSVHPTPEAPEPPVAVESHPVPSSAPMLPR